MAEARSAIDIYYLQKRGVDIGPDYEGYYTFTIKVPTLNVLLSQLQLSFHRFKYGLMYRLWPATPLSVLCVMGGVTASVINANEKSWVRSGWLAETLWKLDSALGRFNPLFNQYGTSFRVGYLASIASFVGMLGIVAVERLTLRGLLSWQGWMFGAKSTLGKIGLKIWGAGVTLLTGKKNLTYTFDSSLPTLPLPSLSHTCNHYLDSVRPLLSAEDYEKAVEQSNQFQKNEGKTFQRYLWFMHLYKQNYVLEWWEKYCYLNGRSPIAVNSNYYVLDAKERPTLDQCQRASGLIHHFLVFKDMIESETLQPMTIRKLIPLCMLQYKRMFGTCRVPGRECDKLEHYNSRHIVVHSRGHYYKLDVYHGAKGTKLRPYSSEEIESQLQLILEHSKRQKNVIPSVNSRGNINRRQSSRIQSFEDLVVLESIRDKKRTSNTSGLRNSLSSANFGSLGGQNDSRRISNANQVKQSRRGTNIAAFTAGPRSRWAEVRESYLADGANRKSLSAIETAAFIVFLEDNHFSNINSRAQNIFHGNGNNRWFDKSINMVVFDDGYAGLNCEHSWADAPAIAHLWEYALLSELKDFQRKTPKKAPTGTDENSDMVGMLPNEEIKKDYTNQQLSKKLPVPKRLLWEIDDEFQVAIDQAHIFTEAFINDVDLKVVEHLNYGKGFIKKNGMSPDGFVQMALQLAYYRDQERFDLTYESSMTRLFRGGRTETTRTLSDESCAFVRAMDDSTKSKEERIKLLKTACNSHAKKNKLMMVGKGIDRHLFALYIVSKGLDRSSDFLNTALTVPYRLSTSQQPQDQTDLRTDLPKEVAERFVSPGGGFGPVADDGYGISYMFAGENQFFFHISSKISADNTSSKELAKHLNRVLEEMSDLFK